MNTFIDKSQPSEPDDHSPKSSPADRVKPFNEEIRSALNQYKKANNLSLSDLAAELGCANSAVSKYINEKPEGDVARLESAIADVLKNADKRVSNKSELFESAAAVEINSIIETILKTNDIGGITGAAGIGKSCGGDLYCVKNPTAVKITAIRGMCNFDGMIRLLFRQVDNRGWNKGDFKGETQWEFLLRKFNKSNRLIIIDNAHRLTAGAIEGLFDFHDATGVPEVFIGNPEFLKKIENNDQQFSRIGLFRELKLKDARSFAGRLLDQYAPAHKQELTSLAVEVVSHQGHGRALKKQISLALELFANGVDNIRDAFRSAHTQLVGRDYPLEAK